MVLRTTDRRSNVITDVVDIITEQINLEARSRVEIRNNMKKILGVLFIIGGLAVGYLGLQEFQRSTNSAEILGVEITANDQGGQWTGIIQIVLALTLFAGGTFLVSKRS
jgi:hypothetical protein